jgi:hypothetical protein
LFTLVSGVLLESRLLLKRSHDLHGFGQGLVLQNLLFYIFLSDLQESILQAIELNVDLELR